MEDSSTLNHAVRSLQERNESAEEKTKRSSTDKRHQLIKLIQLWESPILACEN